MQLNFVELIGIVILLVEIFLSATWNKYYFSIGFPVFVQKVPASPQSEIPPNIQNLEDEFLSSFTRKLVFKDLTSNEYGFREKLFEFRPIRLSAVMHGHLKFDYSRRKVIVKGFADWWVIALSLYLLLWVITAPTNG